MTLPPTSPVPAARLLLERLLQRAKLFLWWQSLWPRLIFALCLTLVATMLVFSGLAVLLPMAVRLVLLFVIAAAIIGSFVWAFWLDTPSDKAALALLDSQGGRAVASSLKDTLVNGNQGVAASLWAAHQARLVPLLQRLKLGLPKPDVARRDPYALRFLVLLLFVPFAIAYWGYFPAQWQAVLRGESAPSAAYRLDAWVTPPAYTQRAPVMLARGTAALEVPQGSIVSLRLSGMAMPPIETSKGLQALPQPEGETAMQWQVVGDGSMTLPLPDGSVRFSFAMIADTPPNVQIEGEPEADSRNALSFRYSAEDDYGVKEMDARFTPKDRDVSRALVPAPDFAVSLPQARVKTGTHGATKDLLSHPWAGLNAKMQLFGRDDAGQEAKSQSVDVVLPERVFSNPLAQVLIDQRRDLALDAGTKPRVLRIFEAWMTAPEVFQTPTAHYLLLSMLDARLKKADTAADLRDFLDALWAYANAIEDGDISLAERDVRAASEALRDALARGASPEEISKLSRELREAINRLSREMAEQARRNGTPQQRAQKPPPGTKIIRQSDIQKMLDRIEELNRQGAKEQAERLMQELQQMLRDMETARQNGQMYSEEGEEGEDALKNLSDMIRRQQQLRDQTFKRDQQQRNRNRQPQKGDEAPSDGELQERQEGLRQDLDQLSQGLGQNGQESGSEPGQGQSGQSPSQQGQSGSGDGNGESDMRQGLGQARRAMREAQDALKRGDRQGAMDAQNRAIRGLQQGAQGLAQQQQQQQGQGQGQQSRSGQGQGNDQDDPLGRPSRRRDWGDGNTHVPGAGESAAQRAQRLVEELRRRLGEQSRPQLELDYIDRLLKGIGP